MKLDRCERSAGCFHYQIGLTWCRLGRHCSTWKIRQCGGRSCETGGAADGRSPGRRQAVSTVAARRGENDVLSWRSTVAFGSQGPHSAAGLLGPCVIADNRRCVVQDAAELSGARIVAVHPSYFQRTAASVRRMMGYSRSPAVVQVLQLSNLQSQDLAGCSWHCGHLVAARGILAQCSASAAGAGSIDPGLLFGVRSRTTSFPACLLCARSWTRCRRRGTRRSRRREAVGGGRAIRGSRSARSRAPRAVWAAARSSAPRQAEG